MPEQGQRVFSTREAPFFWGWGAAVAFFVLAGSTGVLFRFSYVYGPPWGLTTTHLRHAHSHLMYFGWVTPALVALMGARWGAQGHDGAFLTGTARVLKALIVLSLLVYPPFLLFGYSPAVIGEARIPLSVIVSSLHILVWYAWAFLYWRYTRGQARRFSQRLWRWALVFLVLASMGAWGRAVLVALKVTSPFWGWAMVHLFLDEFSFGWLLLAVLGLIYDDQEMAAQEAERQWWSVWPLVVGLPLVFLLTVPVDLTPIWLRSVATVGGLTVAFALTMHVRLLFRYGRWRLPLALMGIVILGLVGLTIPPVARWAEGVGLRIFYLHVLLLGTVSLSLWRGATLTWGERLGTFVPWFDSSVILLLLSLVPLTGLWPQAWRGRWALELAAWVALLPVLVALISLVDMAFTHQLQEEYGRCHG